MPSPFPGMDPYLEAPGILPGLHHALAAEIRGGTESILPRAVLCRHRSRGPSWGLSRSPGDRQRIIPDIAVVSRPIAPAAGRRRRRGGRDLEPAARPRPPSVSRSSIEPIRHLFVEIRDPSRGHKLITLIEILSPSNKWPGPDREAYEAKQREVLESDASLIELDLLRGGRRILPDLRPQSDDRPARTVAGLRRPGQPRVAPQSGVSITTSTRSACATRSRASECH